MIPIEAAERRAESVPHGTIVSALQALFAYGGESFKGVGEGLRC